MQSLGGSDDEEGPERLEWFGGSEVVAVTLVGAAREERKVEPDGLQYSSRWVGQGGCRTVDFEEEQCCLSGSPQRENAIWRVDDLLPVVSRIGDHVPNVFADRPLR